MHCGHSTLCTYLLLLLTWTESQQVTHQKQLDLHYRKHQRKKDVDSLPYGFHVRLYSKGSGSHVQVVDRLVDAKAESGSENAHLVLETLGFGRLRIRSSQSRFYICLNRKGNAVGLNKTKAQKLKRCVYQENDTDDMFTQFRSVKYPEWYLGFTKNGDPKSAKKSLHDQKATKFIKQFWEAKMHNKQKHMKRNIGKGTRNKLNRAARRQMKKLRERQRKRLCLLSSLCLAKKRRQGASWRVKSRCKRISRQNRCR